MWVIWAFALLFTSCHSNKTWQRFISKGLWLLERSSIVASNHHPIAEKRKYIAVQYLVAVITTVAPMYEKSSHLNLAFVRIVRSVFKNCEQKKKKIKVMEMLRGRGGGLFVGFFLLLLFCGWQIHWLVPSCLLLTHEKMNLCKGNN